MRNRTIWAYVAAVTVFVLSATYVVGCRNRLAEDGTSYPEVEKWWK